MAKIQHEEDWIVNSRQLLLTIQDYENYPHFVPGCQSVLIKSRTQPLHVHYSVQSMGKTVSYTLLHQSDLSSDQTAGQIHWELVESQFFKQNKGYWKIQPLSLEKTHVIYGVELEFKIAVPSMIMKPLMNRHLPEMLNAFKKQALMKDQ